METLNEKNTGITLIALVITIIIILILASILITTLMNNNIVTKAEDTVYVQKVADEYERLVLAVTNLQVEYLGDNFSDLALRKELEKTFEAGTYELFNTGPWTYYGTETKKTYKINSNGKIEDMQSYANASYSKNSYGTWIWEGTYNNFIKSDADIAPFIEQAKELKISTIYLCMNPDNFKSYKNFIGAASDENIAVYWVNGDPGMILENHRDDAISGVMSKIVSYNNSVEDKFKIRGAHYDIEPYALSDYEDSEENKQKYDKLFVDFARMAREYSLKNNLLIEYDMHCAYNKHYITDDDGRTINVGEEIAKNADNIVLMDYFANVEPIYNALSSTADVEDSKNWMQIAAENKQNMIVGLDINLFQETYGDTFSRESFDDIINEVSALISNYEKENNLNSNFNFAAHEYQNLLSLKSTSVDVADITKEDIGKRTTFKTDTGIESVDKIRWNVLYTDDSYNYLIANNYVDIATATPKTRNGNGLIAENSNYSGYMSNELLADYSGTDNINAVGNWYLNRGGTDISNKAVDYMLDTEIWKKLYGADKNKNIQWVIGGPTIELLSIAYNEKNGNGLITYSQNLNGYNIMYDSDTNGGMQGEGTFITSSGRAKGTWIAANTDYSDGGTHNTLYTIFNGSFYQCFCYNGIDKNYGFRPVICLKK